MVVSKVRGSFDTFTATIDFDEADPTQSKVTATIDASSINTREPKRDGHLKSADFFDVEMFPELRFESSSVERSGDGFDVHGNLTIHGVTRQVVLATDYLGAGKDPWGNRRVGFQARTTINRKDFGLTGARGRRSSGRREGRDRARYPGAGRITRAGGTPDSRA
jgi:polyisoprenoid-binding protein YceI